jgi:hypothetical protein
MRLAIASRSAQRQPACWLAFRAVRGGKMYRLVQTLAENAMRSSRSSPDARYQI